MNIGKTRLFTILFLICLTASLTVGGLTPATGVAKRAGSKAKKGYKITRIAFDPKWEYGDCAKITSGEAVLYTVTGKNAKGKTVCINAGHGTKGGASKTVLCHPDGSPKIVSGSTAAGATKAPAVGGGMTFNDGTREAAATLKAAIATRKEFLKHGYNVLMIRTRKDVQLDNVARTLIANNNADIHIAIHYDGDGLSYDKGVFFCSVPNNRTYRNMEPVKSYWKKHNRLGKYVIKGLEKAGMKKWSNGRMPMDLTQTSFSTVPSIDLEVGNQCSNRSDAVMKKIAKGIRLGVDRYFSK